MQNKHQFFFSFGCPNFGGGRVDLVGPNSQIFPKIRFEGSPNWYPLPKYHFYFLSLLPFITFTQYSSSYSSRKLLLSSIKFLSYLLFQFSFNISNYQPLPVYYYLLCFVPVDRSVQKIESNPEYITTEGIYRVPGKQSFAQTMKRQIPKYTQMLFKRGL